MSTINKFMPELSQENSIVFASQFEMVKLALHAIDWDYAEMLAEKLREQASFQEIMVIVNPGYPPSKNDLIRLQAEALAKFVEAVRLLRECDELKKIVGLEEQGSETLKQLFL